MPDFPSQYWHDAIAKKRPPMHEGDPQAGYYRDKRGAAVVYWTDTQTGGLRCQVNGRDIEEQRAREQWQYVGAKPVTIETWQKWQETGRWPDQDAVAQEANSATEIDPETDPLGAFKEEVNRASVGLTAYDGGIDSDEQSAAAQTLRATLNDIASRADKKRKALVDPHLEAQRKINGQYQPVVEQARGMAQALAKAMGAWEDTKREQARIAAEKAAKAAAEAAAAGKPEPAAAPPSNAPAPAAKIKGATGRAASVGDEVVATITDQDAVYQYFKVNPVLIECLQKLALAASKAAIQVPGVTVTTKAKIK